MTEVTLPICIWGRWNENKNVGKQFFLQWNVRPGAITKKVLGDYNSLKIIQCNQEEAMLHFFISNQI